MIVWRHYPKLPSASGWHLTSCVDHILRSAGKVYQKWWNYSPWWSQCLKSSKLQITSRTMQSHSYLLLLCLETSMNLLHCVQCPVCTEQSHARAAEKPCQKQHWYWRISIMSSKIFMQDIHGHLFPWCSRYSPLISMQSQIGYLEKQAALKLSCITIVPDILQDISSPQTVNPRISYLQS